MTPIPSSSAESQGAPNVLEVDGLRTHFFTEEGTALPAVDGISFTIPRGKTLALVGESGCGKSVTSYSLLRLIQSPGRIVGGQILLRSAERGTSISRPWTTMTISSTAFAADSSR